MEISRALLVLIVLGNLTRSEAAQRVPCAAVPAAIQERMGKGSGGFAVVNLWSASCEACGDEVSELNSLMKDTAMEKSHVEVIGISVESRPSEVGEFLKYFKPQYQIWANDKKIEEGLRGQVSVLPQTLLFDGKRNCVGWWLGKIRASELKTFIEISK